MQNKYLIFIVPLFGVMSIATLMSMEQEPMSKEDKQLSGSSTHSSSSDYNESQDIVKGIEQMKIDPGNKSKFLFDNSSIEDIANNHLITHYPDEALEYFEKNLNNKAQFKDYLSHISYDLGEIGHNYCVDQEFEKAAKAYLLSIEYYYNNGETDIACFLSEINAFENFKESMNFEQKIKLMSNNIQKFEENRF